MDVQERTMKMMENFHWNVYALRMSRGMTQEELADKAGLSHVSVSRIETTTAGDLYMITAVSIANALGVDVGSLLCKRANPPQITRTMGRRTNRERGKL